MSAAGMQLEDDVYYIISSTVMIIPPDTRSWNRHRHDLEYELRSKGYSAAQHSCISDARLVQFDPVGSTAKVSHNDAVFAQ
jgi:hypothetical protein